MKNAKKIVFDNHTKIENLIYAMKDIEITYNFNMDYKYPFQYSLDEMICAVEEWQDFQSGLSKDATPVYEQTQINTGGHCYVDFYIFEDKGKLIIKSCSTDGITTFSISRKDYLKLIGDNIQEYMAYTGTDTIEIFSFYTFDFIINEMGTGAFLQW